MNWYLSAFHKYAVFDGRASRPEYWWFVLINLGVLLALTGLDLLTGMYSANAEIGLLGGIYSLGAFLPFLGLTIRRLHDSGKSGWWVLLMLIPILGALATVVLMVLPSDDGPNRFGAAVIGTVG